MKDSEQIVATSSWVLLKTKADHSSGINDYVAPASCLVALYLAAHLYLFRRFTDDTKVASSAGKRINLIRSQFEVFVEIMNRIRIQEPNSEPLVIAVEGEWGAGKSWMMREIDRVLTPRAVLALSELSLAIRSTKWDDVRRELEKILEPSWLPGCYDWHSPDADEQKQFAFIFVNAWEYATEHDLHWGLLESLLKHSLVPVPWPIVRTNFLRYPLITLPVYLMRAMVQAFDRGQFSLPGGMSFSFSLSGMLWQPLIDRLIDQLRANKIQVVWCLDEIDRSSPEMAQAAITMVRRFLDQPGSIVLVPYVAQQLSLKVFHPMLATRPDLESNMLAVLYQQLQQEIDDEPSGLLLQERLGLNGKILPQTEQPDPFGIQTVIPAELNALPTELLTRLMAAEPSGSLGRRLRWLLLTHGLAGNTVSRQQRTFLFEEKYLRQAHLKIGRLSALDVQSIFKEEQSFPQIHEPMARFVNLFAPNREERDAFRHAVLGVISRRVESAINRAISLRVTGSGRRPVLRHFLDELRSKLVQLLRRGEAAGRNAKVPGPELIFVELLGKFAHDAGKGLLRFADIGGEIESEDVSETLPARIAALLILVTLIAYVRAGSRLLREQAS